MSENEISELQLGVTVLQNQVKILFQAAELNKEWMEGVTDLLVVLSQRLDQLEDRTGTGS